MKKLLAIFFSLSLYSMLIPTSAFALLVEGAENTDPDMLWNTANSHSQNSDIVCPDPDEEITFEGMRARFMERLKEKNSERYEELLKKFQERKAKLARLCERHPFLYQKIMERKQKLLERLEEMQSQIDEKLCAEFPTSARCEDRIAPKLRDEEERKRFCREFPNTADCMNDDSEDVDEEENNDDDTVNEDNDNDEDRDEDGNDNDDDNENDDGDESNEDEIEGMVASFTLGSSTQNSRVKLKSGFIVEIPNEGILEEDGDITSFEDLTKALENDEIVKMEAEGKYTDGTFVADEVKFEIED